MRSVFYVVGLCYMLGLLFTVTVGIDLAFYFVPVLGLLAVLCAVFNKKSYKTELSTGLLCIAFGILAFTLSYNSQVVPVNQLQNHTAQLTATITEEPYSENSRYYYSIETRTISVEDIQTDDIPQNIKLRISTAEDFGGELYDDIKLQVKFKQLNDPTFYFHNVSNGYYLNATVVEESVELLGSKTVPWQSFINDIHKSVESKLSSVIDNDNCDLLMALLLGDKANMSQTMQDSFRIAGVSHVVVVSGLHLSIIIGFLSAVLSLFIKEKKITAGITISVILMYVVLTGFPYSVIRCAVMSIIYLSSYFVKRKHNALNSLGFAGLVITLPDPLAGGNLGLIMSFTATLGMIAFEEKIRLFILGKIPKKIKIKEQKTIGRIINYCVNYVVNYFVNCVSVSLSATLFTLPVMVFVFESFSVYFLLSNMIITALAPVVIVVGIILTVMLYIPFLSFVAGIVAVIENYLCSLMVEVTEAVSALPMATISLSSVTIKLATVAVLVVVVLFFVVQGFKIRSVSFCVWLSCGVYVMIVSLGYLITSQSFFLQIIDTGSGVTIVDNSPDGVNILCCGGDNYHSNEVLSLLENKNRNTLIIPDYRKYYSKYAEDYMYEFDFENVLVYDTDKYSDSFKETLLTENATYIMDNTTVEFAEYEYRIITVDNKNWLYITSGNSSVLVSPKNADCLQLPDKYRKCDVFVLQSNCTNTEYINCENIVFCGKNTGEDYYYTENGDILLYKFLNGSISLWQS